MPATDQIARAPIPVAEADLDFDELTSAEEFLDYFGVAYEPAIVQVNRLHILQRFHDYLDQVEQLPAEADARWRLRADLLRGAYQDFVYSDARTEKVFRVFQRAAPRSVAVTFGPFPESRTDAA